MRLTRWHLLGVLGYFAFGIALETLPLKWATVAFGAYVSISVLVVVVNLVVQYRAGVGRDVPHAARWAHWLLYLFLILAGWLFYWLYTELRSLAN